MCDATIAFGHQIIVCFCLVVACIGLPFSFTSTLDQLYATIFHNVLGSPGSLSSLPVIQLFKTAKIAHFNQPSGKIKALDSATSVIMIPCE